MRGLAGELGYQYLSALNVYLDISLAGVLLEEQLNQQASAGLYSFLFMFG